MALELAEKRRRAKKVPEARRSGQKCFDKLDQSAKNEEGRDELGLLVAIPAGGRYLERRPMRKQPARRKVPSAAVGPPEQSGADRPILGLRVPFEE